MMKKKIERLRRAKRGRMKNRESETVRLCVHRTSAHIYAQVISADGGTVLAAASTLDKAIRGKVKSTGNVEAAALVGKIVGESAIKAGVTKVAFDRSGFIYHGRIRALADAARASGLIF